MEIKDIQLVLFTEDVCFVYEIESVQEFGFGDCQVENKLKVLRQSVEFLLLNLLEVYLQ